MKPRAVTRRRLLQFGVGAATAGLGLRTAARASRVPQEPPRARGRFLHVWDLQDEGVERVLGWMRDSGLNLMLIAGSYHSGWFVHPGRAPALYSRLIGNSLAAAVMGERRASRPLIGSRAQRGE